MRLLPSTLQVVVEERTPYAIWQNSRQTYVVDAEGVVSGAGFARSLCGPSFGRGRRRGKYAARFSGKSFA